jgi:hypothetical protein
MVVVSVVASNLFAAAMVEALAAHRVGSPPAEAPAAPPTINLSTDRLFMILKAPLVLFSGLNTKLPLIV